MKNGLGLLSALNNNLNQTVIYSDEKKINFVPKHVANNDIYRKYLDSLFYLGGSTR